MLYHIHLGFYVQLMLQHSLHPHFSMYLMFCCEFAVGWTMKMKRMKRMKMMKMVMVMVMVMVVMVMMMTMTMVMVMMMMIMMLVMIMMMGMVSTVACKGGTGTCS